MENSKMKPRKVPVRQCAGCMEHFPKKELIRLVRTPEGEVVLDLVGKRSGRGTYICKNLACFRKARKTRKFERELGCTISEEVYGALEAQLLAESNE